MTIYILSYKHAGRVVVYNSLPYLFEAEENAGYELGVSKATIDRWDFSDYYENPLIVIIKTELQRRKNKPRGITKAG